VQRGRPAVRGISKVVSKRGLHRSFHVSRHQLVAAERMLLKPVLFTYMSTRITTNAVAVCTCVLSIRAMGPRD
jgi:hypothetical protein